MCPWYLLIREFSLTLHELLALFGSGVEEAGLHLCLLILKRNIARENVTTVEHAIEKQRQEQREKERQGETCVGKSELSDPSSRTAVLCSIPEYSRDRKRRRTFNARVCTTKIGRQSSVRPQSHLETVIPMTFFSCETSTCSLDMFNRKILWAR